MAKNRHTRSIDINTASTGALIHAVGQLNNDINALEDIAPMRAMQYEDTLFDVEAELADRAEAHDNEAASFLAQYRVLVLIEADHQGVA